MFNLFSLMVRFIPLQKNSFCYVGLNSYFCILESVVLTLWKKLGLQTVSVNCSINRFRCPTSVGLVSDSIGSSVLYKKQKLH